MATSVTDMGLVSPTVRGVDMVMHNLGNKLSRGVSLTSGEQLIPITVGAHSAMYAYGSDMAHFRLSEKAMPEIALGALANYMG